MRALDIEAENMVRRFAAIERVRKEIYAAEAVYNAPRIVALPPKPAPKPKQYQKLLEKFMAKHPRHTMRASDIHREFGLSKDWIGTKCKRLHNPMPHQLFTYGENHSLRFFCREEVAAWLTGGVD